MFHCPIFFNRSDLRQAQRFESSKCNSKKVSASVVVAMMVAAVMMVEEPLLQIVRMSHAVPAAALGRVERHIGLLDERPVGFICLCARNA